MIDDIFGPFFLERASEAYGGRIENETNRDEPNAGKQKDADGDPYLSCVRMRGTHPITALLRTDWNDEAHGAPRPCCTTCFKCLIVFRLFFFAAPGSDSAPSKDPDPCDCDVINTNLRT